MGTKVILTLIESRIASDGHAFIRAFSPIQRILNVENCKLEDCDIRGAPRYFECTYVVGPNFWT